MIRRSHLPWLITAGAVALRLLMFTGRGHYIAFDEGWYLLLGRSVFDGDGYALSGLRHVALSPLFPLLAGALDVLIGNIVWSGRIIAAVAGGILVVPVWFIALRLGGRTVALLAALFVATMPSLAPFVAPFWIGWDLWVGAEPLLHLFLYAGIALTLRALSTHRMLDGAFAGAAFGLAYLARPEAVIASGVAGVLAVIVVLLRRDVRRSWLPVAMIAVGFALTAAPYWVYLHDALGRWTLTGRDVAAAPALRGVAAGTPSGSRVIDDMLWDRDGVTYVESLYALDASGTRLANGYWGVPDTLPRAEPPAPLITEDAPAAPVPASAAPRPSIATLYLQSLARVLPLYLWPVLLLGLVRIRRRRLGAHALLLVPIGITSVLVAVVVAVDPRTQLVTVPVAAIYIALGVTVLGHAIQRALPRGVVARRFPVLALGVTLALVLTATSARRLYLSLSLGSPHHIVGAENARIGAAIRNVVPADAPLMSWHPAIALFADRDWRVLPHAPFPHIVRYADRSGARHIVISPYYPGPALTSAESEDHIVVQLPDDVGETMQWHLPLEPRDGYLFGALRPAPLQERAP